MKYLFIILLFMGFVRGNCQIKESKVDEFNITEIQIKDQVLRDSIASFISQEIQKDSTFKDIGYVKLVMNAVSSRNKKDVAFTCFYNRSYDEFDGDRPYPHFYTFVAKKLVAITDNSISEILDLHYNKKSIKLFNEKVKAYLPKETMIKFDGKILPYRESIVVIDGGKWFYKLSDGATIVENNTYY